VGIVDLATGHQSTYMNDSAGVQIRPKAISRDDRWVAFTAGPSLADFHIYVAPFSPERPPLRSEWIDVVSSTDVSPYPKFSQDGNLLYFASSRDGNICLWAQRLSSKTKRPEGAAFVVQHFHKPTQELDSPSLTNPLALGATGAVMSITERTSGLWQLDFGGQR
jgi:hypothetical protein